MQLSMWMLYDALSEQIARYHLDEKAERCCIQKVLPWIETEEPSDQNVYVISGKDFRQRREGFYILYGSLPDPSESKGPCQYFLLKNIGDISHALTTVIGAFERYSAWNDALQAELLKTPDLAVLCRLGSQMLKNPVIVCDSNHRLLAGNGVTEESARRFFQAKDGRHLVLNDFMARRMLSDSQFLQGLRSQKVEIFTNPYIDSPVMYINLGLPEEFRGRICVPQDTHPIRCGDYQLLSIFSKYVQMAVRSQYIVTVEKRQKFQSCLQELSTSREIKEEFCDDFRKLCHWEQDAEMFWIKIIAVCPADRKAYPAISTMVEDRLCACTAVFAQGAACLVRIEPPQTWEQAVDRLSGTFDSEKFRVGISDPFSDLSQASYYYQEAEAAAQMGMNRSNREFCYFEDAALLHFARHGLSVLPAVYYCDAGVRKLLAYRNTKMDYYTTLKVYLMNNMSLLDTSQKLYMHRTTLFYRLKKIEEILQTDLSDLNLRSRMMQSFYIMDLEERCQSELGEV